LRGFFGGFALSWIHTGGRWTYSFFLELRHRPRLSDGRRFSSDRWRPRRGHKTGTALLTLCESGVTDKAALRALHRVLKILRAALYALLRILAN
jgi:hypothetical protein